MSSELLHCRGSYCLFARQIDSEEGGLSLADEEVAKVGNGDRIDYELRGSC